MGDSKVLREFKRSFRLSHMGNPECARKEGLRVSSAARAGSGYYRQRYLTTVVDGKRVHLRVNKRPRPECCELCGKTGVRLKYHHWDELNPSIGLWFCQTPCHRFAEIVDKGLLLEKYVQLKKQVEIEFLNKLMEVWNGCT